jgi:3-hydroxyacyl-CoA dehydrogenase
MPQTLRIRKAAVLGAGVMGAQIAAHLANRGIETILFDLASKEGAKDAIAAKAIKHLAKMKPAPLAVGSRAAAITAADYEDNIDALTQCDFVIEAIGEKMDWKRDLYQKIAPHLNDQAILASNTSGLSIDRLAEALPKNARQRFLGVHFFNPPRYMHLVEVIPGTATDHRLLEGLEAFLTSTLGKGVVFAKDTPNFIGNRIGVFSMLSTMDHTTEFKLGFDVVDALTGRAIGRQKSATYRTADVVGLDTMAHVVDNMATTLSDDPWHDHFRLPEWFNALLDQGALGAKSGAGFYRKPGKEILVLDLAKRDYRPSEQKASQETDAILAISDPVEKFAKLHTSKDPQAQFLWACFRDLFHYSAYHLAGIADTARDVDFAIRWGYGWKRGPFETWQAAGWEQVAQWIAEDIAAGRAMSAVPLPGWVTDGRQGVHDTEGSYSPSTGQSLPRSAAPVYRRQLFPDTLVGEKPDHGTTVWENDGIRLWTFGDDDIGIISFKTKMCTFDDQVLDGIRGALECAEQRLQALVVWQTGPVFSAGADLKAVLALLKDGKLPQLEATIANFQQTTLAVQRALVPTVAAVRGLCLGGGCELQMHSARTVAALESYVGLVEAGVGLVPSGGGLKEIAERCSRASFTEDPFDHIKHHFETVAMARVSGSALEAKQLGLLRESDVVIFNADELLYVAKSVASSLAQSGWRPPLPQHSHVAGNVGTATIKAKLVNMLAGHFISEHDMEIASRIADTLCGGNVERGSEVDARWLHDLERRHFMELAQMEKTQARIEHTMKTGKPLRN